MSTSNDENVNPQTSADGRWWWNGQQWVPVQRAPRHRSGGPLLATIAGLIALLVVGVAIVGLLQPSRAPAAAARSAVATPAATAAPTPAPTPLALSGQGSKVLQVQLVAGRYKVDWSAQGHDNFIATLHGANDHTLVNEIPPEPASGETYLSVSDSSSYPLEVQAATLTWTITFTRL